jgi:hypothetical protein
MSAIVSNIKIYGLSILCLACGGMMADIVDSLFHGRFSIFYAEHPVQFWLTAPINATVVFLITRRFAQVARERKDPAIAHEKAGVAPSLVGFKFRTTPFIRICVYAAFYIIGICLVFLF